MQRHMLRITLHFGQSFALFLKKIQIILKTTKTKFCVQILQNANFQGLVSILMWQKFGNMLMLIGEKKQLIGQKIPKMNKNSSLKENLLQNAKFFIGKFLAQNEKSPEKKYLQKTQRTKILAQ